jgi:hypothetical protein
MLHDRGEGRDDRGPRQNTLLHFILKMCGTCHFTKRPCTAVHPILSSFQPTAGHQVSITEKRKRKKIEETHRLPRSTSRMLVAPNLPSPTSSMRTRWRCTGSPEPSPSAPSSKAAVLLRQIDTVGPSSSTRGRPLPTKHPRPTVAQARQRGSPTSCTRQVHLPSSLARSRGSPVQMHARRRRSAEHPDSEDPPFFSF